MEKTQKIKFLIFFALAVVFFAALPATAQAASLYFSPSSGSYAVGSTISVGIFVSSADQAMNAGSGVISFPSDKLEITSLSKSGSIISLWVQEPTFSNSAGTVNFEGIVLNPGFTGNSGKIITATFKAKAAGNASVVFSSGSILANDGLGTNILASLGSAQFNIKAPVVVPEKPTPTPEKPIITPEKPTPPTVGAPVKPKISSFTHPDQNEWYAEGAPAFNWELPTDTTAVRLLVGKLPEAVPNVTYIPPINSKELTNLEDGTWYFHVRFKNKYGWSEILHRQILIDTTPPEPFTIEVYDGGDPTNPSPVLYFNTTDATAGIDYYEIKIGAAESSKVSRTNLGLHLSNPYEIPPQLPGKYTVLVKAMDRAGNSTIATTEIIIEPLEASVITDYPFSLTSGEVLTTKGTSEYPDATVIVFVKKEGKEASKQEVRTDKKGNWFFVYKESLGKGVYQIWAKLTDSRGAVSEPTEKITVVVTLPTLIKFGEIAISYLSVFIALLILIGIIVIGILWILKKVRKTRKKLKKEITESERALRQAFKALREKTKKQVEKLDGEPGLNEREEKICKDLKKALKTSEKFISKKIKDIEKELE